MTSSTSAIALAALSCLVGAEYVDHSLLQIGARDVLDGTEKWDSARDLAKVPLQSISWGDESLSLDFYSAVPTFGKDGNYIALLANFTFPLWDRLQKGPEGNRLLCSGANRSHQAEMLVHKPQQWGFNRNFSDAKQVFPSQGVPSQALKVSLSVNFLCPWPKEDALKEVFEIFLEDDYGKALGKVYAKQNPKLVKNYHTVACVRDVFFERNESFNSPFKQLVEWLEFNYMHGVEHFFVYTFEGQDDEEAQVLRPYLEANIVTRIRFLQSPKGRSVMMNRRARFNQILNDCLYRAKSHATWLLPSIDFDEYFRLGPAAKDQLFGGEEIPKNYLSTVWDAIAEQRQSKKVSSISFQRYIFKRASQQMLEISSPSRSEHHTLGKPPKLAVRVENVYNLWIHWQVDKENDADDIFIDDSLGVVNHYRDLKHYKNDGNANETEETLETLDNSLVADVPALSLAISKRFGRDTQKLLAEFSILHPPPSE